MITLFPSQTYLVNPVFMPSSLHPSTVLGGLLPPHVSIQWILKHFFFCQEHPFHFFALVVLGPAAKATKICRTASHVLGVITAMALG